MSLGTWCFLVQAEAASCAVLKLNSTLGQAFDKARAHGWVWVLQLPGGHHAQFGDISHPSGQFANSCKVNSVTKHFDDFFEATHLEFEGFYFKPHAQQRSEFRRSWSTRSSRNWPRSCQRASWSRCHRLVGRKSRQRDVSAASYVRWALFYASQAVSQVKKRGRMC